MRYELAWIFKTQNDKQEECPQIRQTQSFVIHRGPILAKAKIDCLR